MGVADPNKVRGVSNLRTSEETVDDQVTIPVGKLLQKLGPEVANATHGVQVRHGRCSTPQPSVLCNTEVDLSYDPAFKRYFNLMVTRCSM
jgi:hypothetical protein